MTKKPISINKDALAVKALSLMNSKKITSLCIFEKKNKFSLCLRLIFEFPLAFIKYYLIRRHFTGALTGFVTAIILAFYRWKRIYLFLTKIKKT